MKLDRTDVLVAVFFLATLMATIGMLFDVWQGVYYSIPVLALWCMLTGSLNARDEWSKQALVPVLIFSAVNAALFLAAALLIDGSASFWGLPASTAIFVYGIWPVSTVGASLVYASVFKNWLAADIEEPKPV